MSYTTIPFLIFLAVTAVVYFLFPVKKYRYLILLAASYFFYLWASFRCGLFILFTTATVYLAALWIEKIRLTGREVAAEKKKDWNREEKRQYKEKNLRKRKRILILVLVLNFGILAFLKYFNFLAGSLNGLLCSMGLGREIPSLRLFLPLGISFYTFQATGYLIDVYREKIRPEKNAARFALFVSFFPQIIQGPIGFYDELANQLYEPHSFSFERMKYGIELMMWGYFKKMVIADRAVALIPAVTESYRDYNGTVLFLTVLVYALQLYADFSGGIDISRGFAEILGIRMAENFRRPYFAISINDYWRRWHITLGAWMKTYIFYSVATSGRFLKWGKALRQKYGANAAGAHIAKVFPSCVASVITFLVVGIWHGANWKYVAFGLWNGGVIMISILLQPLYAVALNKLKIRTESFGWRIFQIWRTFLIVLIGYVFDIASGFRSAMQMMAGMVTDFTLNGKEIFRQITSCGLDLADYAVIVFGAFLILTVSIIQERNPDKTIREMLSQGHHRLEWLLVLFGMIGIAVFGIYGPGCTAAEFVYMQF